MPLAYLMPCSFAIGQIVKYSDEVNAFWDGASSGTADGIEKARQKGNLGKVIIVR